VVIWIKDGYRCTSVVIYRILVVPTNRISENFGADGGYGNKYFKWDRGGESDFKFVEYDGLKLRAVKTKITSFLIIFSSVYLLFIHVIRMIM